MNSQNEEAKGILEQENYKKIKEVGRGQYGTAYLVSCEKTGGFAVIKQIKLSKMRHQKEKEMIFREVKILQKIISIS